MSVVYTSGALFIFVLLIQVVFYSGFEDLSMEELRLQAYEAQKTRNNEYIRKCLSFCKQILYTISFWCPVVQCLKLWSCNEIILHILFLERSTSDWHQCLKSLQLLQWVPLIMRTILWIKLLVVTGTRILHWDLSNIFWKVLQCSKRAKQGAVRTNKQ